jgi:hypothetical protein
MCASSDLDSRRRSPYAHPNSAPVPSRAKGVTMAGVLILQPPADVSLLKPAAARAADLNAVTPRGIRTPTARSVDWCSASIWSAPVGSGLLRLGESSIPTDPDGSRRIVWMIKQAGQPDEPKPRGPPDWILAGRVAMRRPAARAGAIAAQPQRPDHLNARFA